MKGRKFNSQIFGVECRNFWDCFRTVRVEFSELFSDTPDRIFEIVFGKSRIGLRFGFDPDTDFFLVLWCVLVSQ